MQLESRNLAPGTINVRLAAIRRLAYEAADAGLLSPELAAGIRRVKGAKKLGIRLGNWLSASEARALCGDLPTLEHSKASATARLLLFCLAVVFDGGSWPTSLSTTLNVVKLVGQSWTSLEKAVTFELSLFPTG